MIDPVYEGRFWEENKILTGQERLKSELARKSRIKFFTPYLKGAILDLGAGRGETTKLLLDLGYSVESLEPDKKWSSEINKNTKCYASYQEITKKFDTIFLSHVLEHTEDPLSFLNQCYDLLNDSGVLCVMVPDCTNPSTKKESMENPYHEHHFTKQEFVELVGKSKFSCTKIDSFRNITGNYRRFHKLLYMIKLAKLSSSLEPYYPLHHTNLDDGYELRALLTKTPTG